MTISERAAQDLMLQFQHEKSRANKAEAELVDVRAINESQAQQIAVIYEREERLRAALQEAVNMAEGKRSLNLGEWLDMARAILTR